MAERQLFSGLRRLFGPSPAETGASSALETKGLPERIRAAARNYITPGVPYSSYWNVDRAVREGYEGNPLVYRAVEVMCQNAIAQRVVLRQGDPDEGDMISEVGKDPTRLLYVLNKRANPWETAKVFRHRLVAQFALSKPGVFVQVVLTRAGRIGFLHLVDPDLVEMVPTPDDPIAAFRIRTPNAATGYDYLPRFDPDNPAPSSILWLRNPHPTVMWEGMSPIQAAGLSIDLDKYARIYNRRFLQNDGRPGGLLSVKGTVNRDTLERIQAQFQGGPESAGKTTVIQADAVSYADTSGSPRDMMWGELSTFTRKDISIAFGVPESVLGDASGRTFDNADAEYEMFWQHRMKPMLVALDDQLDVLTGGFDDDLYLRHDLSKVWVLGRHKRDAVRNAASDVASGLITINEYRELAELDKFPGPVADVLLIPGGKIVGTDDQEIADEVAALPMLGTPAPADPGVSAQDGAQQGAEMGGHVAENVNNAAQLRLVSGGDRAPAALEPPQQRKASVLELEGKQGRAREDAGVTGEADTWR